jgi:hypothetical protein
MRLNNWKTNPSFVRRTAVSRDSGSEDVSSSSRKTRPEVGRSTAPMRLSSVDFPLPDAPRRTAKSPEAMSSDTSSRTCTAAASSLSP